ncbi:siphovirus ReqiPepy6 Gp37-like family protein [Thermoactinomyces daqus]|uniref:Siphovirus ReqiPepy6 Gp37-like family protein n=1 Tax=Thermoactinomyces daqus TaxID=1329516 RepID=A0A7W1XCB6_9BACL|nr:siphovirus ReqiPepy6 Gp37-like family protein [Thermoactinomyces daqus]MBA4544001.1 siphovirus ReqiPepy6 Gp37-like family protein [Thermoactinomyces daqus]
MALYEIWVRDRELNLVGSITTFRQLELTMKFNDVGKWTLDLPLDSSDVGMLLEVRKQGGGIGGILVTRDGNPIFSGPIRNVEVNNDLSSNSGYTFYGTDDNGLLATRLALPPPYYAIAGTGYGYDVFTGPAESALYHLVQRNCAELASAYRRIPGLYTDIDMKQGKTVTIRSRLDPLMDKLQEAALADGNLGFRVLQFLNNFMIFQVYIPQDRAQDLVFSRKRGNLGSYRYSVEAPAANYVIVGGGREGEERTFMYSGDEPSRTLYGTIEMFVDQRSTTDNNELLQALNNALVENTEKTSLEISPLDVHPTHYLENYDLGDRCTVEVEGEIIQDVIRVITITLGKDGEKIVPTVGTPNVGTQFRLFDQYRNLEARVGNLERR